MLRAAVPVTDPLRQPVDLDLFQGPFDLLLTLVLREEVDLFELPLAELVEAALGGEGEGRWDPATTSELVVILAALAEVKARRMLGEPDEDEPDPDAEEARERLAHRLVAYEPFRRAAGWLAEREAAAAGPRYRSVPLETPPAPAARDDAGELVAAMGGGCSAPGPSPRSSTWAGAGSRSRSSSSACARRSPARGASASTRWSPGATAWRRDSS